MMYSTRSGKEVIAIRVTGLACAQCTDYSILKATRSIISVYSSSTSGVLATHQRQSRPSLFFSSLNDMNFVRVSGRLPSCENAALPSATTKIDLLCKKKRKEKTCFPPILCMDWAWALRHSIVVFRLPTRPHVRQYCFSYTAQYAFPQKQKKKTRAGWSSARFRSRAAFTTTERRRGRRAPVRRLFPRA
jgi:hypothetical protein